MKDALAKGRLKIPHCPAHLKARGEANGMKKFGHLFTGSNNNNSKLSEDQRNEICSLKMSGIIADDIALKFHVSRSTVLRITQSRGIQKRPSIWTEKQREAIMKSRKNRTTV